MSRGEPARALARFAAEVGAVGAVAVEGARTRWTCGGPPQGDVRVLRAPSGILDHRPEEMTVRVLAGTPVAELHEALAAAGQRSALPERGGTVGGALAVGENALSSLRRGRLRDAALEISYVSDAGRLVKAGAPTVKNVSGFDLTRLMVGALGTLGLIGEAVLRTEPVPAVGVWMRAPDADPVAVLDAARRASCVLWDGTATFIEIEGHAIDVEDDVAALGALGSFEAVSGPPPLPPHRWSLRPSELQAIDPGALGPFVASIGVGVVFASVPQVRPAVGAGVLELNRRMKAEFDPTGRLNPGRDPVLR